MKVLMINGSPRVNGNTSVALAELEKVFQKNGIETETVQIGGEEIRGCMACGYCFKNGKCAIDDIVNNELASKFEECDGLVVASPVYYASANATGSASIASAFSVMYFSVSASAVSSCAVSGSSGSSATISSKSVFSL